VFDEIEAAKNKVLVHDELKPASTFADLKQRKPYSARCAPKMASRLRTDMTTRSIAFTLNGRPVTATVKDYLSGNLCRCSAYPQIVEAVKLAAGNNKAGRTGRNTAPPRMRFPARRVGGAGTTAPQNREKCD